MESKLLNSVRIIVMVISLKLIQTVVLHPTKQSKQVLVHQIVSEMMRRSTKSEITGKYRLGTNKRNSSLGRAVEFIEACPEGGVRKMIVQSRLCIVCGISPDMM
jgi:hypothetical protein